MLGPIFGREALTLPRRPRHYFMRFVYPGAMWVLALTLWQTTVGWETPATLGDNARFGLLVFQLITFVQLILLMFFSALSAASTVAQEKDRRTFILLLLTDMSNSEIVIGKLFGSLLAIAVYLLTLVPMLAILLLMGGVAPIQIVQAMLILATTALASGSLGSLVALWREKTFQALALTVLIIVLYLCVAQGLTLIPVLMTSINGSTPISMAAMEEVQRWMHPFMAMTSVMDPGHSTGPMAPAYGYALFMVGLSALINGWAMIKLRVWNPSGEPIIQREDVAALAEQKDRAQAHAAPGKVRELWKNPILWREIATRAYGRRPVLVKIAYFVVLSLVAYFALGPDSHTEWAAARGIVPIGILSLLLISTQAVTAVTSERDLGSLDLLLVTDLSPREFIFGKVLGILYNTKEFLLPPLIFAGVYALRAQLATPPPGHPEYTSQKNIESFLCLVAAMIVLMAFTVALGIHVALRTENSRLAVIHSLGTVFFLSVGTLICIYLILINGRFEYQWLSFSAFLFAGIGGLWWVLSSDRPSTALNIASGLCPVAVFYTVTNIIIGKPGLHESSDPLVPLLVMGLSFGFALAAMLVPMLAEFDVAIGRTTAQGD